MIGRSRALNYIKHRGKLSMVPLSEAEHLAAGHTTLEARLLADEQKRIISGAMAQLPEDMRIALHLIYFEDLSYEEAARVMKKNRKQIDNLLYRAKNSLRTTLGKEGEQFL